MIRTIQLVRVPDTPGCYRQMASRCHIFVRMLAVVSVVIVNWARADLLAECLKAVEVAVRALPVRAEIIVVDNGSPDGSVQLVRETFPQVQLVALAENVGFSPAVQMAVDLAAGSWIALVNNDACIDPDCLARLLDTGQADPANGAVNAQVRFAAKPGVINTTGLEIDRLGIAFDRDAGGSVRNQPPGSVAIFGVSGCVALYRKEMLREIGGFDPGFFAYSEDADVAWRARAAGWRAVYEPTAIAYHHGSATTRDGSAFKHELVGRNRVRLIARNATTAQLLRWGWAMALYDLAYVGLVAATEQSLAPVRGRLRGLRDWSQVRRAARATRAPVEFSHAHGWLGALRMHRAYALYAGPPERPGIVSGPR